MTIIVELDDGTKHVYKDVYDAYLAVRHGLATVDPEGRVAVMPDIRSYSWGSNLRELVKEVSQSLVELQDTLREMRHASSSRSDRSVADNGSKHPERMDSRNIPR